MSRQPFRASSVADLPYLLRNFVSLDFLLLQSSSSSSPQSYSAWCMQTSTSLTAANQELRQGLQKPPRSHGLREVDSFFQEGDQLLHAPFVRRYHLQARSD
ncbi:hypothetical protein BDV12DRAFT_22485 [Aspergillus spectabilis]